MITVERSFAMNDVYRIARMMLCGVVGLGSVWHVAVASNGAAHQLVALEGACEHLWVVDMLFTLEQRMDGYIKQVEDAIVKPGMFGKLTGQTPGVNYATLFELMNSVFENIEFVEKNQQFRSGAWEICQKKVYKFFEQVRSTFFKKSAIDASNALKSKWDELKGDLIKKNKGMNALLSAYFTTVHASNIIPETEADFEEVLSAAISRRNAPKTDILREI